jgi:uncharacterized protein (DUF608 family)
LRDWEIMNRPARGFSTIQRGNNAPFFALQVQRLGPDGAADGAPATRALLGPLDPGEYRDSEGRPVDHHGLPRFTAASADAAYPFGQIHLSDPALPVTVTIKGFNPLIPGDAESSGLPLAVLSYAVTNHANTPVAVSVAGSIRNFVGRDGSQQARDWKGDLVPAGAKGGVNTFRVAADGGLRGLDFTSTGVAVTDPAWGNFALVTDATEGVTYRTSSAAISWDHALLDFWDDFSADGQLTEKTASVDEDPMGSLAVRRRIAPGETAYFNFYLTWHFPNRLAWSGFNPPADTPRVGNYYTTRRASAWDAALQLVPQVPALEEGTLRFVRALAGSDYPVVMKEAALFNLSTLRTQTVFRTADGHMFGWEGLFDEAGSCHGSCTHVWNYEQATAFLFGELARDMRALEFQEATDDTGRMSFRIGLPLATHARKWRVAAADGQMGTIVKFYRDWQLSGDRAFLERHWPRVKAALAYAWVAGGWDADQDGVMEGAQHNTMDVDYHGPNPQMGFWYLAALESGARLATAMHDAEFAAKCRRLARNGSEWMDRNLFNGEYYEQRITDPVTHAFVNWAERGADAIPPLQLGAGCLVDQLVGQTMAQQLGLGYLAAPENIRTTLRSIMRYNFKPSFADHFNNMRSFVLGTEAGLVMASWPRGRLKVPFPYFNESMTGFEYTAATGLIEEGRESDALKVITAIRDRFDGRKRNPFDEPECGRHYARAMASWNTLIAWSGFRYSAVDRAIAFTRRPGRYFWSNGAAWGTCEVTSDARATLQVLAGRLVADRLTLTGAGSAGLPGALETGGSITVQALP